MQSPTAGIIMVCTCYNLIYMKKAADLYLDFSIVNVFTIKNVGAIAFHLYAATLIRDRPSLNHNPYCE